MSKPLPFRISRGRRFKRVLQEEHEADEEFWGQSYFQEDDNDNEYKTETDEESEADSDFSTAETINDEHASQEDEYHEAPKRKRAKPPGGIQKIPSKNRKKQKNNHSIDRIQDKDANVNLGKKEREASSIALRESTLLRRTIAEEERRVCEEKRHFKRQPAIDQDVVLPMETFLRQIVEVEAANLASLDELEEYEAKASRTAARRKSKTPKSSVRIRSSIVDGHQRTVMELNNIRKMPHWLQRRSSREQPNNKARIK